MSGAQEGLFAFGADEMFHVPLFAEGVDHPILDRTTTCATNRNAHLIQEKARVYEQMRSGPLIAEGFAQLMTPVLSPYRPYSPTPHRIAQLMTRVLTLS